MSHTKTFIVAADGSEATSLSEYEGARRYDGFDDRAAADVRSLARTFTNASRGDGADPDGASGELKSTANLDLMRSLTSMSHVPGDVPMGSAEIDPKLDPELPEFDSKYWVKNMRALLDSDLDYYKPAKLGFVYKNLRAYGVATDLDYQSNFGNFLPKYISRGLRSLFHRQRGADFDILKPMDGILQPGEVTVVLGRPGAGCSTFLKTIANQTYGFDVDPNSTVSYDGLTAHQINKHFRGQVVYCAETEMHFPQLTVGDTLEFVAKMKTPLNRPHGVSRSAYAKHMAAVVMATYGLSHTKNSKVGNDIIRGVSGGERKRVSIAEVALVQLPLQCWDNSTRGLDSATALEFIKALKVSATVLDATPVIAIYQCSQDAYDLFDKVVVLYEGYQIYFGSSKTAKQYFLNMGYACPQRQTTADFLTSLTNPAERIVQPGYELKVPQTSQEFYEYWVNSPERAAVVKEVDDRLASVNVKEATEKFKQSHNAKQSRNLRSGSAMTVSFLMQVRYVLFRNFLRTKGDPTITLFLVIGNVLLGLIISSIFYNMPSDTTSFYSRTAAMFFAVLFNAFASLLEIFSLYEARPIVEKHKKFALYHPSADALASIVSELPAKMLTALAFNLVLYFMVNFRREPGAFFFYLLMNFTSTLAMSHCFRTIGAAFKSVEQSMTPAAVLLLSLTIFTGFVIPTPKMHGWCRWINYIDPIAYSFEALISNEFSGRNFACSQFIPSGPGYSNAAGMNNFVCSAVGAVTGSTTVNGDAYIINSFQYYKSHKWRNWGILVGYVIFFLGVYIILCEYNKGAMQKGEILLFQQSALKKLRQQERKPDEESVGSHQKSLEFRVSPEEAKRSLTEYEVYSKENQAAFNEVTAKFPPKHNIFHWRNLTYQIKIKREDRIILDDVDGWVKPGQVTALMGASGAGKTTLLNALSERLTVGRVTAGVRMVNGHTTDQSFQRSIGYVQQQDLHLNTSTIREALQFAAYLRQPSSVPKKEKDAYVDYVISLLEMEKYANAVVGVAGEGLNVEQRKRLTIGVELVAKPKLLVFLDEPTSGLDSQTAWSICKLIRKLADHGQAILCTIHQPSAILLQEFDRLLFLQKGGRTVYFGDLGRNCSDLIKYFEKYGAHQCPPEANPAEWMLEVIGAAPGSKATKDWHQAWKNLSEYADMNQELDEMETELSKRPRDESAENLKPFAAGFWHQYLYVTKRVMEQYWRTPSYTYSKIMLSVFLSIFNGFAFYKADRSVQGLQNQMFSVFMFIVVFNTLTQQYLPNFISQRDLYEVRERPSKTFSWYAFIAAQITVEIPWMIAAGTFSFFCWYYPIGLYRNGPHEQLHERGITKWITIVLFFVYTSTMAQLCISFNEIAQNAANICSLLFTMCLIFCGVLTPKDKLPGFWIFMYRVNPFTYLVAAMLSIGLSGAPVECSTTELRRFFATGGQTCGQYMKDYLSVAGGYLVDATTTGECQYCSLSQADVFLASIDSFYSQRAQNIGIFFCFIIINMLGTAFFYWLTRTPRVKGVK